MRPRGRPKNTWQEVVQNDLKNLHLDKSDAMDHKKERKLIRGRQDSGDESGSCIFWLIWCWLSYIGLEKEPYNEFVVFWSRDLCVCEWLMLVSQLRYWSVMSSFHLFADIPATVSSIDALTGCFIFCYANFYCLFTLFNLVDHSEVSLYSVYDADVERASLFCTSWQLSYDAFGSNACSQLTWIWAVVTYSLSDFI